MVTLQELREMILEVSADHQIHTRQELIAYAREQYEMSLYDADQRVTSAIKSLIKKGDLVKLEKGSYQIHGEIQMTENDVSEQGVSGGSSEFEASAMSIHYTAMSGLIQNPRLYSPLYVCLVDRASGEVEEALYDHAAQYCEDIRKALADFRTDEYPSSDLMRCFSIPDDSGMEGAIRGKVQSAHLTAQAAGELLYAVLELDMTEDLTVKELEAFAEQMQSQYTDGWGAAFELQNIDASTSEQLCARLGHDGLAFITGTAFDEMQREIRISHDWTQSM